MDYNQLSNDLAVLDEKLFNGAKLKHTLKLLKYLYDNANGVTNLTEMCSPYLLAFYKNHTYKNNCLNKLKDGGIIEVLDSYIVGSKCKTYRLSNKYLPQDLQSKYTIKELNMGKEFVQRINNDGSVDEDIFFKAVPGPQGYDQMFKKPKEVTVTFKYKGYGDELTRIVTKDIKDTVKDIKESLGKYIHEDAFVDACVNKGIDKELAWYFYGKLTKPF